MFAKATLSISALFTLFTLASAQSAGQCNTGTLQCCNSVQNANSASFAGLLGAIGVPLQGVTGLIGFTCSPITGIGVGGGSTCSQTPVCCQGNSFSECRSLLTLWLFLGAMSDDNPAFLFG
ncbi:hypothetical protein HGRIS_010993 [Hohenbuehelia grisea]|uniref:Hydrophobin n=1 Tax=Hohenbuehelia grisea TaxID=104357 RepID=A0ABR3IYG9_9AGAR